MAREKTVLLTRQKPKGYINHLIRPGLRHGTNWEWITRHNRKKKHSQTFITLFKHLRDSWLKDFRALLDQCIFQ